MVHASQHLADDNIDGTLAMARFLSKTIKRISAPPTCMYSLNDAGVSDIHKQHTFQETADSGE